MTPPDTPEEAPSALSRLERALAGFGEPKTDTPAEREPEPPEPESDETDDAAPEEPAPAAPVVASSSSVLDIAAAVAAVEQLDSTDPASVDEPVPTPSLADTPPASDADSLVLAATAAGTLRPGDDIDDDDGEADQDDDYDDYEADAPLPVFVRAEPVKEPGVAPEPEQARPAVEPQRNIGDPALPYFLVEDNLPVSVDPVTEVDLRETVVRAPAEAAPRPTQSVVRMLAEVPVLLIVAALMAFLVKTFLAQAYYIPSGSMLPQLKIDDRVVVSKLAYKVHDPRRGDIVVFDDPRTGASTSSSDDGVFRKIGEGIGIVQPSTDEFIKRVIGLPGETVEGKNGHVYINGQLLIEPYLKSSVVTSDFEKQKVKPGHLWVMGDNRTGSADSRVFGQIKIDTIVGRALVKVWPLGHASFL